MNEFISQKFRFYAFLSMVLLVFVHGYNLEGRYLQPFSVVQESLNFTTYTEYLLANGLFRFRIPMLFMISAYLFAWHDSRPHGERVKKRLRTLLLPYLCWSAIGLLLTFIFQEIDLTAAFVKSAQIDQFGDNRPYREIGWGGMIERWLLAPVSFQLWFLRSLLIYNALYPLLLKAITRIPKIWFGILILMWIITFSIPLLESEGLLFFSLGIYIQKNRFNIERAPNWLSAVIWLPIFILSALVKTWLAFKFGTTLEQTGYTPQIFFTLSILHKLCVFAGLVTIWYSCDAIVKWFMERQWFVWLTAFSFIIYTLHVPLVNYATEFIFAYTHQYQHHRIITFCLLPLMIIGIAIITGAVMRRLVPGVYAFVTGGRGVI